MDDNALLLLSLGGVFLLGMLSDLLGRHSPLPRVTILLIVGFAIGPSGIDLLPNVFQAWFPTLTSIALAMVGFLLGQKLLLSELLKNGRMILSISMAKVITVTIVTSVGLAMLGVPIAGALLLAAIGSASAPAAVLDVVRESKAKGPFTDTLLDVVAIDDAWGLMLFSLILGLAHALTGHADGNGAFMTALFEIGGALLLGAALGFPMAYLTGRIAPGEPTQVEALGWVLLCGGLAVWLEFSYILATITLGAVVVNFATHHARPFHAIEAIEWPFMILFFMLAGATLHLDSIIAAGFYGIAYILLRVCGLLLGARIGGWASNAPPVICKNFGYATFPQAGIAIGMALIAIQHFPDLEGIILPIVLGSTVIFEIFGPYFTRRALVKVGETRFNHNNSHS